MGGSAWSPHRLGYGRHVPPLARMEPRFTGHGACGGDVKQRYRDAEGWTAGIAVQSRHSTPGTRAKGTGKQRTHERLARRMWGQRNLENCCRKVWGPRYVNKAPPGCGDGLRCGPEPAAGQVEMHRETLVAGMLGIPPNAASPQPFSSNAC